MGDIQQVTCDNFDRAETHRYFNRFVGLGGFGRFFHMRAPTPVEHQDVVRMNRDTLYSAGVFDLTSPVTIVKPDPGERFQSLMPINEDHSIFAAEHDAGRFTFDRQTLGTRYAMIVIRTFADPADPDDVQAANELQDGIQVEQAETGSFEIPGWDEESLTRIRDAYNVLAATKEDTSHLFGIKGEFDRLDHMLGTALGWGGNTRDAALYENVVVERNDGATPYVLTVRDVPVDGFWSVTVYNGEGYLEPNDLGAYSLNDVTAAKAEDGSITIRFGGDPSSTNFLPISPGWNYTVRLYRPRKELLDGSWAFPDPAIAP